jgi:hypothetical protein
VRHSKRTRWLVSLAALLMTASSSAQEAKLSSEPKAAPEPRPAAASASPSAPEPRLSISDGDWVALTLVGDDPHLALYAKEPRKVTVKDDVGDSWSFVCLAPCGQRVDPRRTYRVLGESLVPSVEFNLAPGSGRVALRVHARHPNSTAVTAVLASTGGVAALGGVLLLLLDLAEHGAADALGSASASAKKKLDGSADTYGDVGGGLLVGGVVLGGAALAYLLTAGKTELSPATAADQTHAVRNEGVHAIPFGFSF